MLTSQRVCGVLTAHLRMFVADGLEEHLKVRSAEVSLSLEPVEQTRTRYVLEVLLAYVL